MPRTNEQEDRLALAQGRPGLSKVSKLQDVLDLLRSKHLQGALVDNGQLLGLIKVASCGAASRPPLHFHNGRLVSPLLAASPPTTPLHSGTTLTEPYRPNPPNPMHPPGLDPAAARQVPPHLLRPHPADRVPGERPRGGAPPQGVGHRVRHPAAAEAPGRDAREQVRGCGVYILVG